jgi:molecular chaperone DnaK
MEVTAENINVDLAGDGPVVGIDLGTSNSCACVVVGGQPRMVTIDGEGRGQSAHTLPSVVSYRRRGAPRVGRAGREDLAAAPRTTVFGAKRFVGRPYDSIDVQRMVPHFPYKIVPGRAGRAAVQVNGSLVSMVNVSGHILKAVREAVQRSLQQRVDRAVVTVPAYYNDNQRDAVVQAGRLAGLRVERILSEPTAAAIAYGVANATPRKILVYDLGGGTFDVSVMAVDRGELQVLASAGDTFLGGDDFDTALVARVRARYHRASGRHLSNEPETMARLKAHAEQVKHRLSLRERTMFTVREVRTVGGDYDRVELEIDRGELETAVKALVNRTLTIVDSALREARCRPSDVADVLLVGGQTRMPMVQRAVETHFGRAPRCDLDPDEVVALGAGMFAGLGPNQVRFRDVLPMTIGLTMGQQFRPLLRRNTPVPCATRVSFEVGREDFDRLKLTLSQGDAAEARHNERLGELAVNSVQPGQADPIPMRLDLAMSPDCLLRLTLHNLGTGESRYVLLDTREAD